MKRLLFFILFLLSVNNLSARHLKGGFFSYTYLGPGTNNPNNLRYRITLTEYMDCEAIGQQIDESALFTFFDAVSNVRVDTSSVNLTSSRLLSKASDEICIAGNQAVCFYRVVVYEDVFELPVSAAGYIVSHQRCCRIENMDNLINSGTVGNTYSIQIPGTSSQVPDANKNSSPIFPINDTVVICESSYFQYKVNAIDPDGDRLFYTFCDALRGGSTGQPAPVPSANPPFNTVPYSTPFSGESPLGPGVTINSETGLMSGIAPSITARGEFVVTICVYEYRNDVFVAQSKKELHVKVENCVPLQARLAPKPVTCDGFNVSFSNDVTNPSGSAYEWDFGDPGSGPLNTSSRPTPSHAYTDTGVYTVKLKVSLSNGLCADSTTVQVKVYPGFFPAISPPNEVCANVAAYFSDATTTRYGVPTGWRWDFGDTVAGDTSNNKNPSYVYKVPGNYKVKLIVGNTFGCIDTTETNINVLDKLPLGLPHDTLICNIDTIQLVATGSGTFTWSPNYMINNLNTAAPLISPDVPTMYYVSFLDIQGCTGNDSVFVDVKAFVTINAGNDTMICRTDGIKLNTVSDALHYKWEPSTYLDNDRIKQPIATPLVPAITYKVTGNIGKCQSTDFVTITTVPYPVANAGNDTLVCYEQPVPLHATGGITYFWSPATFLTSVNTQNTVAVKPTADTWYTVTITDNKGCPKPVTDSVLVQVYPKVIARVSNDTNVVIGQPLQLVTTGGKPDDIYVWSPTQWLSNPNGMNPIALPEQDITYTMNLTTRIGNCTGSDNVRVKVFMLPPSFYVPTAFSPNNDGLNEILKPIALGIKRLNYFRVFNRAGKLLFATTRIGEGWDGTYKGSPQDPANYVWIAQGETFEGKVITRKGNAVLVR